MKNSNLSIDLYRNGGEFVAEANVRCEIFAQPDVILDVCAVDGLSLSTLHVGIERHSGPTRWIVSQEVVVIAEAILATASCGQEDIVVQAFYGDTYLDGLNAARNVDVFVLLEGVEFLVVVVRGEWPAGEAAKP